MQNFCFRRLTGQGQDGTLLIDVIIDKSLYLFEPGGNIELILRKSSASFRIWSEDEPLPGVREAKWKPVNSSFEDLNPANPKGFRFRTATSPAFGAEEAPAEEAPAEALAEALTQLLNQTILAFFFFFFFFFFFKFKKKKKKKKIFF